MNRKSLSASKGITYNELSGTALATFKNFNRLAGSRRLKIQRRTANGWEDRFTDVPFVLAESNDSSGRTAYLYIEQKHFIGITNDRFNVPETGEYYEILKTSETEYNHDPYRIIYGIVRIKVQLYFIEGSVTLGAQNRVVFPNKGIYYVTTTTPTDAQFFGWGMPTYNTTGQVTSAAHNTQGGCAAGQQGGACLHMYDGYLGLSGWVSYSSIYKFQIGTEQDSKFFSNALSGGRAGWGGGSNNVQAVLRLGLDFNVKYNLITFDTAANATLHGTLYYFKTQYHRGTMSASNSYNDKLLCMGGWTLATNPFDADSYRNQMEYVTMSTQMNGAAFGSLTRVSAYLACTCNGTNNRVVMIGPPADATAGTLGGFVQLINMSTTANGTSFGELPAGATVYKANNMAGCDGNQNRMVFQASAGGFVGLMTTDMLTLTSASTFGSITDYAQLSGYTCYSAPTDTNK